MSTQFLTIMMRSISILILLYNSNLDFYALGHKKIGLTNLDTQDMDAWNSLPILRLHHLLDLNTVAWPMNLKTLIFEDDFNESLENVDFPTTLKELAFGRRFNKPLEKAELPNSLETLTFGEAFDKPLDNVRLPFGLKTLSFGWMFNNDSLERISLTSWPSRLETLTFGYLFNQPLDKLSQLWPSSIRSITYGDRFNQPLDKVIWPSSLQTIKFGSEFNQPLDKVIWPSSLQTLDFTAIPYEDLDTSRIPFDDFSLPSTLQTLNLPGLFLSRIYSKIDILEKVSTHSTLKTLAINGDEGKVKIEFPSQLTTLRLYSDKGFGSLRRVEISESGNLGDQNLNLIEFHGNKQFRQWLEDSRLPSGCKIEFWTGAMGQWKPVNLILDGIEMGDKYVKLNSIKEGGDKFNDYDSGLHV